MYRKHGVFFFKKVGNICMISKMAAKMDTKMMYLPADNFPLSEHLFLNRFFPICIQ